MATVLFFLFLTEKLQQTDISHNWDYFTIICLINTTGRDLMEPFRPFVDIAVKDMNPQKFEKEEKISIFNLLNDELKIDGRTQTFINAVKIYCKSVFDAIEECDTSLIRFAGK